MEFLSPSPHIIFIFVCISFVFTFFFSRSHVRTFSFLYIQRQRIFFFKSYIIHSFIHSRLIATPKGIGFPWRNQKRKENREIEKGRNRSLTSAWVKYYSIETVSDNNMQNAVRTHTHTNWFTLLWSFIYVVIKWKKIK